MYMYYGVLLVLFKSNNARSLKHLFFEKSFFDVSILSWSSKFQQKTVNFREHA